jgi:tetratricopeptide (TPR) repeat protein
MPAAEPSDVSLVAGRAVAFVGPLQAMSRREAQRLVQQHGGRVVERPEDAELLVVGEDALPLLGRAARGAAPALISDAARAAAEAGRLQVITETTLWQRLGLVDDSRQVQRWYTAAMLAELLGVSISVVRRWQRRGLIRPVREIRKLAYFDFQEICTARRLAELLAQGVTPGEIQRQLAALRRILPDVERPLAQLSVIVQGRHILLRQGDGLLDARGQMRIDFDAVEPEVPRPSVPLVDVRRWLQAPAASSAAPPIATLAELLDAAAACEEAGHLDEAIDLLRVALAAHGPNPEVHFQLAELLYRQGEPLAARERYYAVLELDEEHVEARLNLGCLLAETGQLSLAVEALRGALSLHPDYADAHYHLARTLAELGCRDEARHHWRQFLRLAPESPWAAEARSRLATDAAPGSDSHAIS